MSAQPIHTQTEPTPRERLLAACDTDAALSTLRFRITRAARPMTAAAYLARKGR